MDVFQRLFSRSNSETGSESWLCVVQQERVSDVLPGAADQWRAEPLQPEGADGGDREEVAQAEPDAEGQVQEAGGGAAGGVQGGAGGLDQGNCHTVTTATTEVWRNSIRLLSC